MDESTLENIVMDHLGHLGYATAFGPHIAPGEAAAERSEFREAILSSRLFRAITRLNPTLLGETIETAIRTLLKISSPSLVEVNHHAHRLLIDGIPVESRRKDGTIFWENVKLIDFDRPENNDFLAVNQFTVIENGNNRRADVVLFVNGLPLITIELKNPADEKATIWTAFNQLQTYKKEIPSLFQFNELLIISDGLEARVGTITADR